MSQWQLYVVLWIPFAVNLIYHVFLLFSLSLITTLHVISVLFVGSTVIELFAHTLHDAFTPQSTDSTIKSATQQAHSLAHSKLMIFDTVVLQLIVHEYGYGFVDWSYVTVGNISVIVHTITFVPVLLNPSLAVTNHVFVIHQTLPIVPVLIRNILLLCQPIFHNTHSNL